MTYSWKIQLFAGLSDRFGSPVIYIETETPSMTVAALKQELAGKFPEQADLVRISFVACNQTYASDEFVIQASDELAVLPPVSGGEPEKNEMAPDCESADGRYVITKHPITSDEVLAKVIVPEHGAAIAFVGTTREWTMGQRTVRLEYEAYAPMAVRTMEQIGMELSERWPGTQTAISHRIGVVDIAETSVVIAVSSPHRDACYEASRYAIERLKQIVPIWKKEIWEDGSEWKGHQLGSPWNPIEPISN
ncbi:molybdopterin synthase catalytic subunit [Paenibacillus catalpae]|uniref:Molybdopterin synthase catalytic subunit n=1 Tax=Paenibacillus catalpae TaxID=1045775 RepID=A0A1I1YU04_9BACL|nr:molybdenum cofactor biosynthesis protein MoaE [Paenibacillus catalpae]SFE21500.1 molybdopterin synthase catalytic subunit [Paenibacillus catalpae]